MNRKKINISRIDIERIKKFQNMNAEKIILNTVNNTNTPYIVYYGSIIKKIIYSIYEDAKDVINFKLYYSIKANNNNNILEFINKYIDGMEVASEFEYKIAHNTGCKNIISTFPAPNYNFIKKLYNDGYIFDFDSKNSIMSCLDIVKNRGIGIRVKFPINCIYNQIGMSRFGIFTNDIKLKNIIENNKIIIKRIHYHYENQNIENIKKICNHIYNIISKNTIFKNVDTISLGGGLDILYGKSKEEIKKFWEIISQFSNKINSKRNVSIIFEPGSLLVSSSGYLITSVRDSYVEDGDQKVIIDTSAFNLFQWYTPYLIFPRISIKGIKTSIYGCTCYEKDIFIENILLPKINIDEKILFAPVGAYTISLSKKLHMLPFPKEILIEDNYYEKLNELT